MTGQLLPDMHAQSVTGQLLPDMHAQTTTMASGPDSAHENTSQSLARGSCQTPYAEEKSGKCC